MPGASARILEGREHRRARLADVALGLFSERGYSGVSVEDIAAAAGYTRASVYNHFRGKALIYLHIIARKTELLAAAIERRVAPAEAGLPAFDALVEALIVWTQDEPSFFFLYFVARVEVERDMTAAQRRSLEESHHRLLAIVRDVFDGAIAAKAFQDIDAPTAANLFFASIVGAILLHRTHDFRATLPELLQATAHYFLRGVGAARGPYRLRSYRR